MPIRNIRQDVGGQDPAPTPEREATVEEMLALVARMTAYVPHVPCADHGGPFAELARALNQLSSQLSASGPPETSPFSPQSLLTQAQSLMISCDTQARIRFINRIHPGLTAAQMVGTVVYEWLTPESIHTTRPRIEKTLATGESSTFEGQTTSAIGSIWYTGLTVPIRVEEQIVGFTLIVNDITELKRTQARMEHSHQELEAFAYVASHDLQEPLRKIQTFGERLKTTCSAFLPPEGRDAIECMQQAAARMRRLIDELLAFSRVSARGRPFSPVDLGAVAREVLDGLETALARAGARVSLGELPLLEADPVQMRQLLQYLLGHALESRREDTPPRISVHATVDPHAQRCELVVEDNGPGFEEQHTGRLFEVLQRLRGHGPHEGTGIGLAICRKIAERHGGHITASSTPGQGTTVRVTLPLKPPPVRAPPGNPS